MYVLFRKRIFSASPWWFGNLHMLQRVWKEKRIIINSSANGGVFFFMGISLFYKIKSITMALENCLAQASYRLSNFRPPSQRLRQHRFALAYRVSFIERTGPSSLYGDDQGASAFLIDSHLHIKYTKY